MSAGVRVAAFAALLVAIFGVATLAGAAIGPDRNRETATAGEHADTMGGAGATAGDHGATHGAGAGGSGAGETAREGQAGLASAQDGYRLVTTTRRFTAGRPVPFAFAIVDARGATVRAFETEQARRMHLIVVRRDLRGYQHLHPVQGAAGDWSTRLTLPDAGVYRAFADFRIGGEQRTLGVDLFVAGRFAPRDLPAPRDMALADGYAVSLHRHGGELSFAIRRGGVAVADLQPYLGAYGHLVVLREGDLAYRHVHPVSSPRGEIAFEAGTLQPARYRLFVQFRHAGRVHTAAFTHEARP